MNHSPQALCFCFAVIGISGCDSARFLQVLVDAVDVLSEEARDSSVSTLSSLQKKLETLLVDDAGAKSVVALKATDTDLLLELELEWDFNEVESLNIDLAEIIPDGPLEVLARTLVPAQGDAIVEIEGGLTFKLGMHVEYDSDTGEVNTYIMKGTIYTASFFADGKRTFESEIGPLTADAEAEFFVGGSDSTTPLKLDIGLPDNKDKHILDDSLVKILKASFSGTIDANIDIDVPLLASGANVSFTIMELDDFFQDPASLQPSITQLGLWKIPSLFGLLLPLRDKFVDSLEDMLRTVEKAVLGPNGAVTKFRIPFLRNGLGSALDAGTDNNILARIRRKTIPRMREVLAAEIDAAEATNNVNIAEILRQTLEATLDKVGLLGDDTAPNVVSVQCFERSNDSEVDCVDGTDLSSVMWTIPLKQGFRKVFPFDFTLDEFPLEIRKESMNVESGPSLEVSWTFDLAFGFDKKEGFFLQTFPDKQELEVEATFGIENTTILASLFFLAADMSISTMTVDAGVSVDIQGPFGDRLTRGDFRRIRDKGNLFKIAASADASLESEIAVMLEGGDSSLANSVEMWIPQLNFEIDVKFQKRIGGVSNVGDVPNTAKITNVFLDLQKAKMFVGSVISRVTDYLDEVMTPLGELNERLPGVSDVAGKDITVLDFAEVFIGEKSGVQTVRTVIKIYEQIRNLSGDAEGLDLGDGLLLAAECDLLNDDFECMGGLSEFGEDFGGDSSRRRLLDCTAETADPSCEAKRMAGKLAGLADNVDENALQFPVFSKPLKALDLLQGRDIVSRNESCCTSF